MVAPLIAAGTRIAGGRALSSGAMRQGARGGVEAGSREERLRIARERSLARAQAKEENRLKSQAANDNRADGKAGKARKPIGAITMGLMVAIALLADTLQLLMGTLPSLTVFLMPLAGINYFIWFIAGMTFFVWFLLLGRWMPQDAKGAGARFGIVIAQCISEIAPILNGWIFGITGSVVSFIFLTITEDREAQGKAPLFSLFGASRRASPQAGGNIRALMQMRAANMVPSGEAPAQPAVSAGELRARRRSRIPEPEDLREQKNISRGRAPSNDNDESMESISDTEKVFFREARQTPQGIVETGKTVALPRKFQPSYSEHVRSWTDLKKLQEQRQYTHVVMPDERNPNIREYQFLRRDQVTGSGGGNGERDQAAA